MLIRAPKVYSGLLEKVGPGDKAVVAATEASAAAAMVAPAGETTLSGAAPNRSVIQNQPSKRFRSMTHFSYFRLLPSG